MPAVSHVNRRLLESALGGLLVLFAALAHGTAAAAEPTAAQLEFFERQVRPLLATHCYRCHSATSKTLQAGLRVDGRDLLLQGGDSGPAIVPGDADASLLIQAVRYEAFEMPPQGKLDPAQVDLLVRWIAMGAPWPEEATPAAAQARDAFDLQARRQSHWAWQPVRDPRPPEVVDAAWPACDIDRFILAGLEQAQLTPAPAVDRRGLIRRLYFDLIGLPPTAQQVQRFVDDPNPDAVQRVVDQLLASPHFGERWGRHWLDLVRYAESRGHEHDNDAPGAYQYRDYVIRGWNADVPYDQWVREHLAGDLLDPPRLHPSEGFNESILGTGFWFLGEWVHSPVDIRKEETDRLDNMIDVMSKAFLGLTVACARCHDHKFDAITTRDYYSLAGFLQSCDYRQVRFETLPTDRRIARQLDHCDAHHRARLRQAICDAIDAGLDELPAYLIAAREALTAEAAAADTTGAADAAGATGAAGAATALVARRDALDDVRLGRWIATLRPLLRGTRLTRLPWEPPARDAVEPLPASYATTPPAETASQPAETATLQPELRVVVDYAISGPDQFMQNGFAFGSRPLRRGDLLLGGGGELSTLRLVRHGAAAFDPIWNGIHNVVEPPTNQRNVLATLPRPGRTLRTPTFALQHPHVACLVRGSGHVVACVDSHRLVYGPLHQETIRTIAPPAQADALHWVRMDLQRYVGHRLHLELTPDAAGRLHVLQVVSGSADALNEMMAAPLSSASAARPLPRLGEIPTAIAAAVKGWRQDRWQDGPQAAQQAACLDWALRNLACFGDPQQPALARVHVLAADWQADRRRLQRQIPTESRTAMAMLDGTGEEGQVLIRGSSDHPGPFVARRFLEAIDGDLPLPIPRGSGRLQLADRINDPANPLPARVIVNRIWHHLLGRGIVPTVDDFGFLGQPPSHPELLDHLASWFLAHDRSIKQTVRYIVLSRTYQLSSLASDQSRQRDPNNRLWQHLPPRRLQGEAIRDSLLAVSGQLDRTMFGPSVPIHLTDFMDGRGRPSVSGPLDGAARRSLYIAVRRNFLSPFQLAFDAPAPFSTMGRRNVSNVPAQALILMNDPLVVSQARHWALRALATVPDDASARIEWMYNTAFARPPTEPQRQLAVQFVQTQAAQRGVGEHAPDVWSDLAHILMNLKEFIYLR